LNEYFDGAKPRFLNRGKKRRSVSTLSIPRASDRGVEWVDFRLHNFAWVYVILSNLSQMIFTTRNNFSHLSPTVSLFRKSFSIFFHSFHRNNAWCLA